MSAKSTIKRVTAGNVTLTVAPWRHPSGRDYWRFSWVCPHSGVRKFGTRATKPEAVTAAHDKALELSRNGFNPADLTDAQVAALQRLLAHDPALSFVDDYLAKLARQRPTVRLRDALAAFLATKQANRAASVHNTATLERHLDGLLLHLGPDSIMADASVEALQSFIDGTGNRSARYRLNIRRSVVTFFRWARRVGHLPDEETAAEKTEVPLIVRGIPATYSVDQMRTILTNADPKYLPWFALAAFAGVRGDEMLPLAGGEKSPLDWADVHWDQGLIVVRPETAKTKHKRVIPLCAALRSWLEPYRRESGQIVLTDPRRGHSVDDCAETTRLGRLIGGWKANALRHSFISYRAAQVGLGKTAMEAGNSEGEAKRSYNSAMSEAEANSYFAIYRPDSGEHLRTQVQKH